MTEQNDDQFQDFDVSDLHQPAEGGRAASRTHLRLASERGVPAEMAPPLPDEAYADEFSRDYGGGAESAIGNEANTSKAEPGLRRFKPASSLHGKAVPERPWLVKGWVPSRTVTILGGDGGTGKSLLAMMLLTAAVLGVPWLGRGVAQGRTIYVSAEDDEDELHRRIDDVSRAYGVDLRNVEGLSYLSLAGDDALLASQITPTSPLTPTAVFREIDAEMTLQKPVLLVLDTLADLFPGNENDRSAARQFIGLLRGLAIRHNCAVLLLAHPSLSGLNSGSGTSGSTAWNNSVRSRIYLERVVQEAYEPNPDARVLTTKKSNYGRVGGEIPMTWRDGVFVADEPDTALDRMVTNAKAERVFLKLLAEFTTQGRRVNPKGSNSYAPKAFAAHPQSEGVTKRAFLSAMETLLSDGRIKVGEEGPPSRRVQYLEEVK